MVVVFKILCAYKSPNVYFFQASVNLNTVDGIRLKKKPSRKMYMFVFLNLYRITQINKIDVLKKGHSKIIDSVSSLLFFFTNYANKNYIQFENILSRRGSKQKIRYTNSIILNYCHFHLSHSMRPLHAAPVSMSYDHHHRRPAHRLDLFGQHFRLCHKFVNLVH